MEQIESRICKNCRNQFGVDSDDVVFYKKIQVPLPTFCPECRLQRRIAWRNERILYRRTCDATGKDILAIYPPEKKLIVYDQKYWWSDAWDPISFGRDYDFLRPFFAQFAELMQQTPQISVFNANAVNSEYCNYTVNQKNCYLVSAAWDSEETMYSNRILLAKDSSDLYVCPKNESCYENVSCKNSYRLMFSALCNECTDSAFLYNCRNCQSCFGCVNLRHKSYCIGNVQYTKAEYEKRLSEIGPWSVSNIAAARRKLEELKSSAIRRYAEIYKCTNVVGDNVEQSKNCYWCFDLAGNAENAKWAHWGSYGLKDSYDVGPGSGGNSELVYEGVSSGVNNARLKFTVTVWNSHDVEYSVNCHGCNNCFGCVSLKNAQYCVFNKQYTKEEYEQLVEKIKAQMAQVQYVDKRGIAYGYGEFFPSELSTFAYNESVAQEYFPMRRDEAVAAGYLWHDPAERSYNITKPSEELPETIKEVTDDIMKETIGCAHNGTCHDGCVAAFRITPQELLFYRKFNLPLPRLCFNCRHYSRLQQRNPMKLWHRACTCAGTQSENNIYKNTAAHFHGAGHCPNEFETSYAPDRPEIVYCEQCYNGEVV